MNTSNKPNPSRTSRSPAALLLCLLAACTSALAADADADADADGPRAKFQSLFGKEAKSVSASASTKDDAKFAVKLLDGAKALADDPDLGVVLYEKAYEFGLKDADGYAAAAEAMKQLAEAAPERQAEAGQKLLSLYQLRYRKAKGSARSSAAAELAGQLIAVADGKAQAGDDVEAMKLYRQAASVAGAAPAGLKGRAQSKVKAAEARQQARAKAQKLEQRLRDNPGDPAAAVDLVKVYLLDLDDPAKALEHAGRVTADVDPRAEELLKQVRQLGPRAARELSDLEEGQLLELAEWYAALADGDRPGGGGGATRATPARTVALSRAKSYGEAFLEIHPEQDAERLRAAKVLEAARKGLGDDPAAAATTLSGAGVDLLALVDPARDAVTGVWKKTASGLVSDNKDFSTVEIPYTPPAEYDVEVSFTRAAGDGGVCVILHANGHSFLFNVGGYKNTVAAFARVKGEVGGSEKNPTTVRADKILTNGKRHTALLRVRRDGVKAFLDGKAVTQWKTDFKDASLDPKFATRRKDVLGLAAQSSPTAFHAASLVAVSGEGKVLGKNGKTDEEEEGGE